jgi:hypothetical protein
VKTVQEVVIGKMLVGGRSPSAALSAGNASRYGVSRAMFIGRAEGFQGCVSAAVLPVDPGARRGAAAD